jgi:hypothetical protein
MNEINEDATDPASPATELSGGSWPFARHLVIVHQKGWQSLEDWRDIAQRVRRLDPSIAVFVVGSDHRNEEIAKRAAERPSLIVSAGPLGRFKPLRGKVYHGQIFSKLEQLRRLVAAGVPVPRTAVLRAGLKLDPALWGRFVIVKPTDIGSSSHGQGIQLMRTERVRYIAPADYPEGHPGRSGPMIVQQYIHTGAVVGAYRVLTLFGEPLYCEYAVAQDPTIDLSASDEVLEQSAVATQGLEATNRQITYRYQADVAALARAAHFAIPEAPLKGCDIVRDAATGRLYVLELNPGGNTWHFSSDFMAESRARRGPEVKRQRLEQLDAFGSAAQVLARMVRTDAV